MSVQYPSNVFTRMIESVSRANASGLRSPVISDGEPKPSVETPAMRRPMAAEEPLSAQEHEELNRLAIAAGIQDPRLGNMNQGASDSTGGDASQDQYEGMTTEEVIALGASVRPPKEPEQQMPTQMFNPSRQSAQAYKNPTVLQQPRLPNFKNVQGISLIDGVVYLDDMSFPISQTDLVEFRKYVVEVARTNILAQLEEAARLFTMPEGPNGGTTEETLS